MELFGVQELPNSRAKIEPGWAYVQDTNSNIAITTQAPINRKRAARHLNSGISSDTTARQDSKVLRDLASFDRDSHRDVQIAIPVRHRDNAGRISHGKVTPNVRKILQSQKTFANHLSDAEALAALAGTQQPQPPPATITSTSTPSRSSPASTPRPTATSYLTSTGKRSHKKKDPNQLLRRASTLNATESNGFTPPPLKAEQSTIGDGGASIAPDASEKQPILTPLPKSLELKTHPADDDQLLQSRVPSIPSEEELEALLAQPPLTYLEARGQLTAEDESRPVRSFCDICGYWGRVRCLKCGSRVCALECLRTHQEECYTRYGA